MSDTQDRRALYEAQIKDGYRRVSGFGFFPADTQVTESAGIVTVRALFYALIYCAGLGRHLVDKPTELARAWATSGFLDGQEEAIMLAALALMRASFEDAQAASEALRIGGEWLANHWDELGKRGEREEGQP